MMDVPRHESATLLAIWQHGHQASKPLPRAELTSWKAGDPASTLEDAILSRTGAAAALRYLLWAQASGLTEIEHQARALYKADLRWHQAPNPGFEAMRIRVELQRLSQWKALVEVEQGIARDNRERRAKGGQARAARARQKAAAHWANRFIRQADDDLSPLHPPSARQLRDRARLLAQLEGCTEDECRQITDHRIRLWRGLRAP